MGDDLVGGVSERKEGLGDREVEAGGGRRGKSGHEVFSTVRSHRQSGGDSRNAPWNVWVGMEITTEKMKGNRNYLFLLSLKNRWKQWYKIDTSLFFP